MTSRDDQLREALDKQVAVERELREAEEDFRRAKDRLGRLRSERDRAQRRTYYLQNEVAAVVNGFDPLVVPAAELRPVVERWTRTYGHGAQMTLARRTGVDVKTIARILGRARDHGKLTKFFSLRIAEKILIAIDEENALRDGRIRVVSSPSYKRRDDGCDDV